MPPLRSKRTRSSAQAALLVYNPAGPAGSPSYGPSDDGDDDEFDVHIIEAPSAQLNLLGDIQLPDDVLYLVPRSLDQDSGQDIIRLMKRLDKLSDRSLNKRWVPLCSSPRRELWEAWTRALGDTLSSKAVTTMTETDYMGLAASGLFELSEAAFQGISKRTSPAHNRTPPSYSRRQRSSDRNSPSKSSRLNVCTA